MFTRIHLRNVALGLTLALAAGVCAQAQSQWQGTPQAAAAPMITQATTPPPTPQAAPVPLRGQAPTPRPGMPAPALRTRRNPFTDVRSGTVATKDGLRLHLETEIGSVRVLTDAADEVRYQVTVEAYDSGGDGAQILREFRVRAHDSPTGVTILGDVLQREVRDRLWVTFELHVPRDYNIDVTTQAGNIQVEDIDGRVSLITHAGNITAGQVGGATRLSGGPAARLESLGGGHISVRNVAGDLRAVTVGGHITAGNVLGDATLTTGGGHIHAGTIGGVAQLETGGGNITVESAAARVTASSGGGQISFGRAAGAIQAHAAGGGIRVLQVAGPMQLDSSGGSIFLTRVENSVHATTTGTGSITAWLSPTLKLASGSQLESGQGDVTVYLPRQIHVTVQATIDGGATHHITSDPALPMKISYVTAGDAGKQVHGECVVNGGGEVLHLRAVDGNIQLRIADDTHLRQQELMSQHILQDIQIDQRLFQTLVQQSVNQSLDDVRKQLQQAQEAFQASQRSAANVGNSSSSSTATTVGSTSYTPLAPSQLSPYLAPPQANTPTQPPPASRVTPTPPAQPETEVLWGKLGELWWGGVPVDPAEQQRRLVHGVPPVYPDVARQAGIAGTVSMRVLIDRTGRVFRVQLLSGEASLQDAAVAAVKQWRYQPYMLDGKPAPVMTTINLEFRLQ